MRTYVVIIFFLSTLDILSQKTTNIIKWEEGVTLKPEDFRATKGPNKVDRKGGLTTYKIEILPKEVAVDEQDRIIGYQKMTVAAYFYKNKSWLWDKGDNRLLIHEQLHFDIAELFARKIRKAFKKLKTQKIKYFDAYQLAYNKLWQACRVYQKEYDLKTLNGTDYNANEQWATQVRQELLELQAYQ